MLFLIFGCVTGFFLFFLHFNSHYRLRCCCRHPKEVLLSLFCCCCYCFDSDPEFLPAVLPSIHRSASAPVPNAVKRRSILLAITPALLSSRSQLRVQNFQQPRHNRKLQRSRNPSFFSFAVPHSVIDALCLLFKFSQKRFSYTKYSVSYHKRRRDNAVLR